MGAGTKNPQRDPEGKDAEGTDLQGGKLRPGNLGNNGPASNPPGQAWSWGAVTLAGKEASRPGGRRGTEKLSWVMQVLKAILRSLDFVQKVTEGF